jgi:small subunit ribosomal protein S18
MAERKGRNTNKIAKFNRGRAVRANCWFCENEVQPDYKDVEIVRSFLSPRGKILTRRITGTCAKHQRPLSTAIKIARMMALVR